MFLKKNKNKRNTISKKRARFGSFSAPLSSQSPSSSQYSAFQYCCCSCAFNVWMSLATPRDISSVSGRSRSGTIDSPAFTPVYLSLPTTCFAPCCLLCACHCPSFLPGPHVLWLSGLAARTTGTWLTGVGVCRHDRRNGGQACGRAQHLHDAQRPHLNGWRHDQERAAPGRGHAQGHFSIRLASVLNINSTQLSACSSHESYSVLALGRAVFLCSLWLTKILVVLQKCNCTLNLTPGSC